MSIKLPAALFEDGRAARVLNRLVSGLVRHSPLRVSLARRACRPLPPDVRRVLFVCKGNICRSAYAEAVARRSPAASSGWVFHSAGLGATPGTPPPESAVRVARSRGVDLSAHRARSVADFDPAGIDAVFVMEPVQAFHPALGRFRARAPIRMLGMAGGDPLIADPYGRGDAVFESCFGAIERALQLLWGDAGRS
jgi:protein-tyrosine phosphatase